LRGVVTGFALAGGVATQSQKLFRVARPNTTQSWVLDAGIEGAFNNIGHTALLQAIGNFLARELIKQWFKAGYVEDERLHPTETGVPQGGAVSPLLLNVALHGMEQALGISYTPEGVLQGTYALVRNTDDLAVLCPTQEKAIEAQEILSPWLRVRGL
jgi:RNA-directed DNA polymerase